MKADKPFVTAVIVGAGSGTRMGGVNKALIKIGDKTAFRMVLDAFGEAECINEIVVVCRDTEEMAKASEGFDKKPVSYVLGGKTRTQSVFNGVSAANRKCAFYCIHDCARPLVTPEIINQVTASAIKTGAATACTPVTDTIKYVDSENGTVYTPDRSKLLALQTPQVFEARLYTVAAAMAKKEGYVATDDTALAEHAGFKVEYVLTDKSNLKLTGTEDVLIARYIEQKRRKTEQ